MLTSKLDIFVDGGGNAYAGMQRYLAKLPSFHRVYVFEPNPLFKESYGSDVIFIEKAIWIEDTTLPFYISQDERQVASSLLQKSGVCQVNPQKKFCFHTEPIEVVCIDFSRWIDETIQKHHRLTLKLDIEGAEYEVLWKMIKDKTIQKVHHLYVEFHKEHLKISNTDHERLIFALKDSGVILSEWD